MLHVSSLVVSPRALHLPHSLFLLRQKNTKHNRYNKNNSENTQYITHISKLPRLTSCAIKNHSGVKTCRVAGNPRTTTPTGYEPKELATVSRIEAYSGDPYQLCDVQEKVGEEDHRAPVTDEVKVFGEIGTAGVPEFKLSETSCIQSQMHFDDSVESIADSDLEDGELQKDADYTTVCPESFGETPMQWSCRIER